MEIIQISVPTPFYVGDVNVYLIKDDPLTLIDVGPKTPEASQALLAGLAANGVSISDIRRIVLTHAHEDHCGLARSIRDQAKDAEVFVHGWETGHLVGRLEHEEHREQLAKVGVPDPVIEQMRELYDDVSRLTDTFDENDTKPLKDEMELEFASGTLKVLHTPGHTPGSCAFFREADRTLICGDCVLKRITPNPMLAVHPLDRTRRFASLGEYLVSLARLRALSPTLALGGHGEPITDFDEIFHRYRRSIDERQSKVVALVRAGAETAFDVAARLFESSFGHGVHKYLAISEAIAHLDYAAAEGKVVMEKAGNVEKYRVF